MAAGHAPDLAQLTQGLLPHEAAVVVTRAPPAAGAGGAGGAAGARGCGGHKQPRPQQAQQQQQHARFAQRRPAVPSLNFGKLKGGGGGSGPVFSKNLPDEPAPGAPADGAAAHLDASARAFEEVMARPVAAGAPLVDRRCYVYKAVNQQVRGARGGPFKAEWPVWWAPSQVVAL
jgi:hypothetical protein